MANRKDLIAKVAEIQDITKKDAAVQVDAFLDAVEELLVDEGVVSLTGFGKFEVRERAARKGRNPQTGAEIEIPATKSVGFKAGKGLKEFVNWQN